MIELEMVRRMATKGLVISPFVVAVLWLLGGPRWGISAAIGLGMALANLWLSARLIGGVAERNPALLVPAALASFLLGLVLLTAIAALLQALDVVFFPVTGFTLIGAHLVLVLWEAVGDHAPQSPEQRAEATQRAAKVRS